MKDRRRRHTGRTALVAPIQGRRDKREIRQKNDEEMLINGDERWLVDRGLRRRAAHRGTKTGIVRTILVFVLGIGIVGMMRGGRLVVVGIDGNRWLIAAIAALFTRHTKQVRDEKQRCQHQ